MLSYNEVFREMVRNKFGKNDIEFVAENVSAMMNAINCANNFKEIVCGSDLTGKVNYKMVKILKRLYPFYTKKTRIVPPDFFTNHTVEKGKVLRGIVLTGTDAMNLICCTAKPNSVGGPLAQFIERRRPMTFIRTCCTRGEKFDRLEMLNDQHECCRHQYAEGTIRVRKRWRNEAYVVKFISEAEHNLMLEAQMVEAEKRVEKRVVKELRRQQFEERERGAQELAELKRRKEVTDRRTNIFQSFMREFGTQLDDSLISKLKSLSM